MLTADHLRRLVVPANPVAWHGVVYTLKRFSDEKSFTDLHWLPDAGEPRPLTGGDWTDRLPTPGPDGLWFVSDRSGGDQVWRIDRPGADPVRLTALPAGDIRGLAVRHDGAVVVAFAAAAPTTDLPLAVDLREAPTADRLPDTLPGFAPGATVDPPKPRTPLARVYARARNREDGAGWFGGRAHLWRLDPATGALARLTSGDRDFSDPVWLGDALYAAASIPGPIGDADVTRGEIVRVEAGSVVRIDVPEGRPSALSPSPDGSRLAYVATMPDDDEGVENPGVYLLDPASGATRLDPGLDRPALDLVLDDLCAAFRPVRPVWIAPDRLIAGFTDRGSLRLRALPLDGGKGRWLSGTGVFSEPVAVGDRVVGVWSTAATLPELAELTADGVRLLSAHNADVAREADLRAPERLALPNGATAWYLAPRTGEKAPAILYVHGGPCVCYGERLFLEMHWWADRGYAVLWPNPRGGQGHGAAFAQAITVPHEAPPTPALRTRPQPRLPAWGTADAEDLLAFSDLLAARPEVDPARIAVAGGSYGGYMGLHLAATSDRFAAAIFERGLYDWTSCVGSSDFGHAQHRLFAGEWPWENPAIYLEQSPIRHVSGVKCPSLVIHAEGDLRVGPEQGLRLFAALLQQGTPTALVLFPEESHGLTRTGRLDRRLERLRQIGAWLERWL